MGLAQYLYMKHLKLERQGQIKVISRSVNSAGLFKGPTRANSKLNSYAA